MCSDVSGILEFTRPAETAFDIIFVINILMTFITATNKVNPTADNLGSIFKESAWKYTK